MTTNLMLHAPIHGLVIAQEHPENSGSISLSEFNSDFQIQLYLPLDQWHALRNALPKHKGWAIFSEHDKRWLTGLEGELFAKAHYIRMTTCSTRDLDDEEAA
jgi:hypothetical protein